MTLRRKITSSILDAAATGAAYMLIGAESARRNVNRDNARKLLSTTKHVAVTTGKVAVHTARNAKVAATRAKVAVSKRKSEILAAKSEDNTLF